MWVGFAVFILALVVFWIRDAQIDSYRESQESWGGLGELFTSLSGRAQSDRKSIVATHFFGVLLWGFGAVVFGGSLARWGYWLLFQRMKTKQIGFGPVEVPGSGFRFLPPQGWTLEVHSYSPFPVCFGSANNGFRPNIVFELDTVSATLDESIMRAVSPLREYKDWIDISFAGFTTNQNRQGVRYAGQYTYPSAGLLRIIYYALARSDGVKILIFCTAPLQCAASMEPLFDKAIKAITVE